MTWTKEIIREKLEENQRWLERGLVAVYNQQTRHEQEVEETIKHNGRGFNSCDARLGSYLARWVVEGRRLNGIWVHRARKLMLKYAGQLTRIANKELVSS